VFHFAVRYVADTSYYPTTSGLQRNRWHPDQGPTGSGRCRAWPYH
jgi:hypothetical protein